MYRENRVKAKVRAGKKTLGFWSGLGSPFVTELLALTGLDFLVLDQEHGFGEPQSLALQLQALSATETTSIVRVPSNDRTYIKRVLDAGVEGLIVPSVDTAELAEAAVAACHYPPVGRRGSAIGSARASNYGMAVGYGDTAGENLLVICQVESIQAVENIDAIAAVEGIDVLFIGPFDLSGSIGHLGEIDYPDVAAAITEAERGIKAAGKAMGTVPHPGKSWSDMFNEGYDMVSAGSDVSALRNAGTAAMAEFRKTYPQ